MRLRFGTPLRLAPLVVPLVILIATGLRGLDFGMHWDERHYQIGPVKTMVQTGILLPNYYGYPSFVYWVNTASALRELPAVWRSPDRKQRLLAVMDTHEFLLRLRAIYLVLSSLSLVWVYWLVLSWRDSVPEAFAAAAFLGLSWEVAYHLRWIATDSMLMQFGALTMLLAFRFQLEPHRPRLLHLAAIAAGFGCGTKYPGGLLIVPVVIAAACTAHEWRAVRRRLLGVGALFAGAYLVTTPATILHPGPFLHAIRYEIGHYASGHEGHSVAPGGEHVMRMLAYLGGAVFSAWPVLALSVFALCLLGCYATVRDGKPALVLLSFPVLYLAYFATQRAMVVRNLLVLVPFLAVMAARGAGWLWEQRSAARVLRPLTAITAAIVLLMNAGWLVYAAETIPLRRSDAYVRQAAAFLSSGIQGPVWISPRLRIQLAAQGWVRPSGVVDDPLRAERLVLYASEGMTRWQEWPANRPWLTERWFGPHEVNFNIYPSWWGDDRIIVMSRQRALSIALLPVAPGRFEASLAGADATLLERAGKPRAPLSRHAVHPCGVLSRDEITREIGSIVDGPSGVTAVDGRACQYAGRTRVVALGLFSIAAFEAQRPEAGGVMNLDIGDAAYWHFTGPDEVSLFARVDRLAIMVRVAVADRQPAVEIAARLARVAIDRLRSS